MNPIDCSRESEMLQTVAEGRWPESCDPELRSHVLECAVCVDLIEVAVALSNDRESGIREVHVPGSGVAWWRIQMRMRQESLRASQRTVTFVQIAMLGAGLIVALALLSTVSTPHQDWMAWLGGLGDAVNFAAIAQMIQRKAVVILVSLATLTLIPAAAYFAFSDD